MELLATRDGQRVRFRELVRPYDLDSPFMGERYICILFVNDETVTADEQSLISSLLVRAGCRYAVCTGYRCSS